MINIIKGQDRTVRITFQESDGTAWSLSGMTDILVYFPAATTITKQYTVASGVTVVSEAGGIIEVTLTDTETGTMTVGYGQHMEIIVDKGTTRKLFQVLSQLNVVARLF
jgi:hypothetical protein